MNKPESEIILKVVYINSEKFTTTVKQARRVVDAALEMLKVSRYPITQIRVAFDK